MTPTGNSNAARRLLTVAALLIGLLLAAPFAGTASATGGGGGGGGHDSWDDLYNPSWYSFLGHGACTLVTNPSTPYQLGAPPGGSHWSFLVLIAGTPWTNDDWVTTIANPQPGSYNHPSGDDLWLVIKCWKSGTSPGPTTTSTSTTVPAPSCDDYTPTQVSISPTVMNPGDSVTITGTINPGLAGVLVTATLKKSSTNHIVLGSATTNASGQFTINGVIPANLDSGNYTIKVTDDEQACCPGGGSDDDDDNHSDNNRNGRHDDNDDDDGYGNDNDDDDDGGHHHDDDDGGHHHDDDEDDNNDCPDEATVSIVVVPPKFSGCGFNSEGRTFFPGQEVTWTLHDSSFNTSKPVELVLKKTNSPAYSAVLYGPAVWPSSNKVSFTIPLNAPLSNKYQVEQVGKKKNSSTKTQTKTCPVTIEAAPVPASAVAPAGSLQTKGVQLPFVGIVIGGVTLASLAQLRIRRARRS